jgi:hypothetical protein
MGYNHASLVLNKLMTHLKCAFMGEEFIYV